MCCLMTSHKQLPETQRGPQPFIHNVSMDNERASCGPSREQWIVSRMDLGWKQRVSALPFLRGSIPVFINHLRSMPDKNHWLRFSPQVHGSSLLVPRPLWAIGNMRVWLFVVLRKSGPAPPALARTGYRVGLESLAKTRAIILDNGLNLERWFTAVFRISHERQRLPWVRRKGHDVDVGLQ